MRTRISYSALPEHVRDYSRWPTIDLTQLGDEDRARAERLSFGIKHYLDTGELNSACKLAACSKSTFYAQLSRCVQPDPTGVSVIGWMALIPHRRISDYRRKVEAPGRNGKGFAGAFQQFLESHPAILNKLISLVRNGGGTQRFKSSSPMKRVVYQGFKDYCLSPEGGLKPTDYPFNTRNGGKRAVERFTKSFILVDPKARVTWFGSDVAQQVQMGTGQKSFRFNSVPFETVASDTYTVHCTGIIIIDGPGGPQPVNIDRLLYHPFVDDDSRAIISYGVGFNSNPNSRLIEDGLIGFAKKWQPRDLVVEGFDYPPNAMLPVGNIEGLDAVRPCILTFDNASAHYGKKIALYARQYLGAAVLFGPIRSWSWNAFCERLFLTLSRYGFQQLSTSTGSNTADPLRPDFVANAIRDNITWETILDLIDICTAVYNATPSSGLGGKSPIEVLRNRLSYEAFVPRPAVPLGPLAPRIGITIEIKTIAGRTEKGAFRTPYVQVDKVHYGGACIAKRFDLIHTRVAVHIDETDMRKINVYALNGELIGELTSLDPRWSRTKHTRATRKEIMKMIREGEMQKTVGDYIMEYMALHQKQAQKEVRQNPRKKSQAATKLAETLRQSGLETVPVTPQSPMPRMMRRPIPNFLRGQPGVKNEE